MRRLVLVTLLVLLLGCQQSPAPGPEKGSLGSLTVQLREEGDALAARGEYEAAAVKYRAAINREPEDVSLRFALGTALSHLGRRQETVEQFRFVISRGNLNSQEFQAAQRWLVSAGELAETAAVAPAASPEQEVSAGTSAAPTPAFPSATSQGGRVKVRTEPRPGTREVNIILADPRRALAFQKSGKLGETFEFETVLPGNYQLTAEDRENGTGLWNLDVTVAAGKEVVLDLK